MEPTHEREHPVGNNDDNVTAEIVEGQQSSVMTKQRVTQCWHNC